MRCTSLLLLLFVASCAGGSKAATSATPREVRLLDAADPALRPLSLAAAGYLKQLPGGGRVGFAGVTIESKPQSELSAEIVSRHGFVAVSGRRLQMDCQPVQSGRTVAIANCRFQDFDILYTFEYFRIAKDSGYVGAAVAAIETGRPQSYGLCITRVVDSIGWKPSRTQRLSRSRECGTG